MKKTISINISGIVFYIEEDGYEKLKHYLATIQRYFSSYEDSQEIIADIESRIAEIFLAKLSPSKQVITVEDVDKLMVTMGSVADFEAIQEEEPLFGSRSFTGTGTGADTDTYTETGTYTGTKTQTTTTTAPKKLYRDLKRKLIGGVAAGIAHYFGIDPIWIRLLFLAAFLDFFFLPGSISGVTFLAYVVLWIVTPGSDTLVEDTTIKKLYRNPDKRTIGGVASGIAAYFGTDETVVRLLFVLSLFLGGAGLLVYLVLWAIMPEAKTITEKMQMQGEPVTLSNIEYNIKKNFGPNENGEENILVKILLFPFRLIATIFSGLSKAIGPIALFLLDLVRIGAGILLIILSFVILVALTTASGVGLGVINAYDFIELGDFPIALLQGSIPTVGIIAAFISLVIPAICLGLLGITLVAKHKVIPSAVGWTLFSIWVIGLIATGVTVPAFASQFRTRAYVENTETYPVHKNASRRVHLAIQPAGHEEYKNIRLALEGYDGNELKLVQRFEARGRNRQDALENAKMLHYNVRQKDSVLVFDSNFSFVKDAKFRAQSLFMTLYIPYEKVFSMESEFENLYTDNRGNYSDWQFENKNNLWKFTQKEGLVCLTCKEEDIVNSEGGNVREFKVKDFNRLDIGQAFEVQVNRGDAYKVVIRGDKDDIKDIIADVENDELNVYYKRNKFPWKNSHKRVQVNITMPELKGVNFHSASEASVEGFEGSDNIDIQISSAARAKVNVQANRLTVDVNGAGALELKGKAENLEADISSAGKLDAFDFVSQKAKVDVSSAGVANVFANEKLDVDASSGGSVHYRGDAQLNSDVNSGGSVGKD